jgi:hypothetical protein
MKRKVIRFTNYDFLMPEQMDTLLFEKYGQYNGAETWARVNRQFRYYDYYDGKQHIHPTTKQLVRASEMPRPPQLDYDPTRYTTNYFKSFIQRKARWQMGGHHGINVKPQDIDPREDTAAPDYEPSPAQEAEFERARGYEELLYQLWDENKMREELSKAARDRLIAGRVAIKLVYNPKTGKLVWRFRPDTEVVPVFSDDDFEDMIACHFVKTVQKKGEPDLIRVQTFELREGECYVYENIYTQDMQLEKVIQAPTPMAIEFIPVVLVPVAELTGKSVDNKEVDDMMEITNILNQLNEDAIDSLKFEMFPITAFINVPEGTSDNADVTPGAMIEIGSSHIEGVGAPRIEKIESNFTWGEIFDEQYSRLKGALHEITNLPNIVPQELNFGGLNGEALHVLFHSIIKETQDHWLVWDSRLRELHEKSVKYLQARTGDTNFSYDKQVVRAIGDNYDHEINFVLPLPDDRAALVELLIGEVTAGFESQRGAIERLGVDDVNLKVAEINNEKQKKQEQAFDLYGEEPNTTPRQANNNNNEEEENDG